MPRSAATSRRNAWRGKRPGSPGAASPTNGAAGAGRRRHPRDAPARRSSNRSAAAAVADHVVDRRILELDRPSLRAGRSSRSSRAPSPAGARVRAASPSLRGACDAARPRTAIAAACQRCNEPPDHTGSKLFQNCPIVGSCTRAKQRLRCSRSGAVRCRIAACSFPSSVAASRLWSAPRRCHRNHGKWWCRSAKAGTKLGHDRQLFERSAPVGTGGGSR